MYPNRSLIYDLRAIYDQCSAMQRQSPPPSPEEIQAFLWRAYNDLLRAYGAIQSFEQRLAEERAKQSIILNPFGYNRK